MYCHFAKKNIFIYSAWTFWEKTLLTFLSKDIEVKKNLEKNVILELGDIGAGSWKYCFALPSASFPELHSNSCSLTESMELEQGTMA